MKREVASRSLAVPSALPAVKAQRSVSARAPDLWHTWVNFNLAHPHRIDLVHFAHMTFTPFLQSNLTLTQLRTTATAPSRKAQAFPAARARVVATESVSLFSFEPRAGVNRPSSCQTGSPKCFRCSDSILLAPAHPALPPDDTSSLEPATDARTTRELHPDSQCLASIHAIEPESLC